MDSTNDYISLVFGDLLQVFNLAKVLYCFK